MADMTELQISSSDQKLMTIKKIKNAQRGLQEMIDSGKASKDQIQKYNKAIRIFEETKKLTIEKYKQAVKKHPQIADDLGIGESDSPTEAIVSLAWIGKEVEKYKAAGTPNKFDIDDISLENIDLSNPTMLQKLKMAVMKDPSGFSSKVSMGLLGVAVAEFATQGITALLGSQMNIFGAAGVILPKAVTLAGNALQAIFGFSPLGGTLLITAAAFKIVPLVIRGFNYFANKQATTNKAYSIVDDAKTIDDPSYLESHYPAHEEVEPEPVTTATDPTDEHEEEGDGAGDGGDGTHDEESEEEEVRVEPEPDPTVEPEPTHEEGGDGTDGKSGDEDEHKHEEEGGGSGGRKTPGDDHVKPQPIPVTITFDQFKERLNIVHMNHEYTDRKNKRNKSKDPSLEFFDKEMTRLEEELSKGKEATLTFTEQAKKFGGVGEGNGLSGVKSNRLIEWSVSLTKDQLNDLKAFHAIYKQAMMEIEQGGNSQNKSISELQQDRQNKIIENNPDLKSLDAVIKGN